MHRYLYLVPNGEAGVIADDRLEMTTERHKLALQAPELGPAVDPCVELERDPELGGVVFEMYVGWPGRQLLWQTMRVLRRRRRVWLYWPEEKAIECVDRVRLPSYWRQMFAMQIFDTFARPPAPKPEEQGQTLVSAIVQNQDAATEALAWAQFFTDLRSFDESMPIEWPRDAQRPIPGCGVYLRTDFWNRFQSGGSYGHTCYVAKELAAATEKFVCFFPQRYQLLDQMGVHQVVLESPSTTSSELEIMLATRHFYRLLKPAFQALKPAFIYERICLGNYAGALLSHELGIPYIVEYNGSEISMHRSFGTGGLKNEDFFVKVEDLAFRQATVVSVVSSPVKSNLLTRGVNPDKVLTNPNGVDPQAYAPLPDDARRALRAELGFTDQDVVIGFSGTFGGWHGVDVLAASMPQLAAADRSVRFLLIGSGDRKQLVDAAIERAGLEARVRAVGRVPQHEGARLLPACDIFVSPHSAHMTDSRFFGSPTKLFEYMAVGGGIVASDLEQIGRVLSPALRPDQLTDEGLAVGDERAVLCMPGDVDEFVEGVLGLVRQPDVRRALGRNARAAACDHYSWRKHVEHLLAFARKEQTESELLGDLLKPSSTRVPRAFAASTATRDVMPAPAGAEGGVATMATVTTGDSYKDEVQRQWNHNPVGSHYVRDAEPHTLEWYLEAEHYRYGEYAPWMPRLMEYSKHCGEQVLEIGGGMGTDLAQFAANGAIVTDLDLSRGHLSHAQENFRFRGLTGTFVHHDGESLPFGDNTFDLIYSNGVLHHTPQTQRAVGEIYRVLKPGGCAIVMMYAESSLHYWRNIVYQIGIERHQIRDHSIGEIMSRAVEITEFDARPLVKVYTKGQLRHMFRQFRSVHVYRRQLVQRELPKWLSRMPLGLAERLMGWNLIVKAQKPR